MSEPATKNLNGASARFAAMTPAEIATATAESEGWQPAKNDELQGVVVAIKSGKSEYKEKAGLNPNYPIIFILPDDSDTVKAVHCFHSVLENEVKSQRPMPGENIYIKSLGTREGAVPKKGESLPERYAVHVEREAGTSDPWEHM